MNDTIRDTQAEQLRQNEELYRLICENLRDHAIFTIDSDGKFSSWNPGVEDVLGYTEDEFIGQPDAIIFTPEDRERDAPERDRKKALETGRAEGDRWHVRKDGSLIWVNGILAALHDSEGKLRGFAKIMRDGTKNRQQQEELQRAKDELERRVEERTQELNATLERLRRSEQNAAEVFRAAPFAAAVCTTAEGCFLAVNRALERLSGYGRDELIGRVTKELGFWSSEEDQQKLRQAVEEHADFRDLELQLRTKDGMVRDILVSGTFIDYDGTDAVVKMFYDITGRKQSEEQLSRAIQEVMADAAWFSRAVVEKLANIRSGEVDATVVAELTPRERQVLGRIASGMNNEEIAKDLGIGDQTVRNYTTAIYSKIHVRSRAEAVVWARERGLVAP